jgi:hypothetical protein
LSGRFLFFVGIFSLLLILLFGLLELYTFGFASRESTVNSEAVFSASTEYNRSAFGEWADLDGDCLNTRNELLLADSFIAPTLSSNGCKVIRGKWLDIYSGEILTISQNIDVDHLVPLSFAWKYGASNWTDDKKTQFYNDEDNIILTGSSINRSKGDSSPLEWMPKDETFRCEYVSRFIKILSKYSLVLSPDVMQRLDGLLDVSCN